MTTSVEAIQQNELTQLEIDNAIAITQEVMRSELNREIEQVTSQLNQKREAKDGFFERVIDPLLDEAYELLEKKLKKDSDLAALIRAVERFMAEDTKFDKTLEFKKYQTRSSIRSYGLDNPGWKNAKGEFTNISTTVSISNCNVVDTDGEEQTLSFIIDLPFTEDGIKTIRLYETMLKEVDDLESKRRILKAKLSGIPEKAKELKAQLLTRELARSERGREVLQAVTGLVTQALGATPALLERKNDD